MNNIDEIKKINDSKTTNELKELKTLSENSDKVDVIMNPVPYIKVRDFTGGERILHGFSTKLGGVSGGWFKSLNLGFKTDDSRENVISNYKLLGESMGFDYERLSLPDQVHDTKVIVVGKKDAGVGIVRENTHLGIDAQITNVKNLPLIVFTADCVPILLYDPIKEVIGTAHAGWRGTVNGIAAKTIKKMQDTYGCSPEDIRVAIGPSIGPDSYEVDDVVVKAVSECPYLDKAGSGQISYTGLQDIYGVIAPSKNKDRYMLNLWKLNELISENAGVLKSNIFQTEICTMKQHDIFFSHRYTNGRRGLQAGVIMLK